MDTEVVSIVGFALVAAAIAIVIKNVKPEFALLVSLCTSLLILYKIIDGMTPVISQIKSIIEIVNMPSMYISIMFKSLGICLLAQMACDACRDAGENAIASKVEMAGRVAVLVISLPLFTQVISIVSGLIG